MKRELFSSDRRAAWSEDPSICSTERSAVRLDSKPELPSWPLSIPLERLLMSVISRMVTQTPTGT